MQAQEPTFAARQRLVGPAVEQHEPTAGEPRFPSAVNQEERAPLLRQLHSWYATYMAGPEMAETIPALNSSSEITNIEASWLRWEVAQCGQLPGIEEFQTWFLKTAEDHVQTEFCRYLAEEASLGELALFIAAEEMVDSRFDDIVAMVQIGLQGRAKMTAAENYWDEMGRGELARVHTTMFQDSVAYMRSQLSPAELSVLSARSEILENACILLCFGIHRRYALRALGAMGLLEQSASPRFQAMVDGCRRVGVPANVIAYQAEHVHVDAEHGAEWFEHILSPLAQASPNALDEICKGILIRKRVADAYYQAIWEEMRSLRERRGQQ